MQALTWLWRAFLFFVLFAFALNNQHEVEVRWFFGYHWQAPMVFVVLAAVALGCVVGVLAMVPSWWRHRRDARDRLPRTADASPAQTQDPATPADTEPTTGLPSQLPHPPDVAAPRKPAR